MTSRAVLLLVFANARLRRVVLAFAGFNLADWARWLSILIFAFDRGGAAEAGVVSLLQLLPAAVIAPLAASLGDRIRRDRVLLFAYTAQGSVMTATALAIVLGAPAPVVYGLAVLGAILITLARPAHGALLPWIARSPAELTAANAASGMMEGVGILIGQAVAGILLAIGGSALSLFFAASAVGASALLVLGLGVHVPSDVANTAEDDATPTGHPLLAGMALVAALPGPRTIIILLGLAAFVWGALDVLIPVLALELADIGPSGVGFLNAVMGVGGLAGSAIALTLAGRIRLAVPFAIGLIVWGLPLAGIGVNPTPWLAAGLLLVAGAGRTVLDVVGRTLLQRASPDAALSRVLGVLEGTFMAAFGLGSIATPAFLAVAGPRGAFILVGLLLPCAAIVAWGALRAIDRQAKVPLREIALLRGIAIFAPLGPAQLERLASNLEVVRQAAGTVVMRQGDPGDRYYVVAAGEVEIEIDRHRIRTEGPGGGFGEIALIQAVPRTATVRALTDVELLSLQRDVFLAAVTGDAASRAAADAVVQARVLGDEPAPMVAAPGASNAPPS